MKKFLAILFLIISIFFMTLSGCSILKMCGASCYTAEASVSDISVNSTRYVYSGSFTPTILVGLSSVGYQPIVQYSSTSDFDFYYSASGSYKFNIYKGKTVLDSGDGITYDSSAYPNGFFDLYLNKVYDSSGRLNFSYDVLFTITKFDAFPFGGSPINISFTQSPINPDTLTYTYTLSLLSSGTVYFSAVMTSSEYVSLLTPVLNFTPTFSGGFIDDLSQRDFFFSTAKFHLNNSSSGTIFSQTDWIEPFSTGFYPDEIISSYSVRFGANSDFVNFNWLNFFTYTLEPYLGAYAETSVVISYWNNRTYNYSLLGDDFSISLPSTYGLKSISISFTDPSLSSGYRLPGFYISDIPITSDPLFETIFSSGYSKGEDYGYQNGYDYGYSVGESAGYDDGYDDGYADASEDYEELHELGLFGTLLTSIDSFMNIGIFGTDVTFGTILSMSFGVILLGIAMKIFLGG